MMIFFRSLVRYVCFLTWKFITHWKLVYVTTDIHWTLETKLLFFFHRSFFFSLCVSKTLYTIFMRWDLCMFALKVTWLTLCKAIYNKMCFFWSSFFSQSAIYFFIFVNVGICFFAIVNICIANVCCLFGVFSSRFSLLLIFSRYEFSDVFF